MKIGRNDPCPCGSGKKYKACCEINNKSAAPGYVTKNTRVDDVMNATLLAAAKVKPIKAACLMFITEDGGVAVMPYLNPAKCSNKLEVEAMKNLLELLSIEWNMFITGEEDPTKYEQFLSVPAIPEKPDLSDLEVIKWAVNTLERKIRTLQKYIDELLDKPARSKSEERKLIDYKDLQKDHRKRLAEIEVLMPK